MNYKYEDYIGLIIHIKCSYDYEGTYYIANDKSHAKYSNGEFIFCCHQQIPINEYTKKVKKIRTYCKCCLEENPEIKVK